ncbi:MAG: histidinol-phosphate transaminase [Aigarchaeota archaeon]|nr:histidinol-phosphate transaminase [Aigarchaeota archaeon]MCX8192687.1 histidinol-phosphate transaminase [Nitrososphaeria archaeon]MDW7987013.1 histidinol-phosphate transaminase [Nitrososphaerota archaeon]
MKIRELFSYFTPYEWETPSWMIAEEHGLKLDQIIRMDMNTSPYLPLKWLKNLESKITMMKINNYPDTTYRDLVNEISNYVGVKPEKIIPTNGADEAIDIIVKTFIDCGSEAILSSPTYDYFRVSVELQGGKIIKILRKNDFTDNVDGILSSINEKTRIIFLCSPNNPTGNITEYKDLIRILDEVPDVTVVVDEAYYEYSGRTFIELTETYDNLIIVRTLSKAFGLAGARIGYIVTSKETAKLLNKARPPNSLNTISIELAVIALRDSETVIRNSRKIVKERERVRELLSALPKLKVYPSEANFLLFKLVRGDSRLLHKRLIERGIVIRNLDSIPELRSHLRVTISLPEHNNKFLKLIEKLLEEV